MKTFTVSARHGQGRCWVLEAPEAGSLSQVRRPDQAEEEVREAIAYLTGTGETDVAIEDVPTPPTACDDDVARRHLR